MSDSTVADPRAAVSSDERGGPGPASFPHSRLSALRQPRADGPPEHQLGILGGIEGTQLPAWCEPRLLERVADELEHPTMPGDAPPSELEEIAAELQQGLRFDGSRPKYTFPELAHLEQLDGTALRAYCEHPDLPIDLAKLTTKELAKRLRHLWRRRGRGLSELDHAVQREWSARSLGFGYFYAQPEPHLPAQLVQLAGRRAATQRRLVLAAVCISLVRGALGLTISAPEAERLWGIPASTWWQVIAWLEERGLVVRMRRWKNNAITRDAKGERLPPVQFCPNWIGPGPVLLARLDEIVGAFRKGTPDENRAAQEMLLEQRRERARVQRRRERGELPTIGEASPAWVVVLGRVLHDDALAVVAGDEADERWKDALAAERGRAAEVLGGPRRELEVPPSPDLAADVEALEALGELGPAELRDLAVALRDAARPTARRGGVDKAGRPVPAEPMIPTETAAAELEAELGAQLEAIEPATEIELRGPPPPTRPMPCRPISGRPTSVGESREKGTARRSAWRPAAPSRSCDAGDSRAPARGLAGVDAVLKSTSTNRATDGPAIAVAPPLACGRPRGSPAWAGPNVSSSVIERAAAALGVVLEVPNPTPRGEVPP